MSNVLAFPPILISAICLYVGLYHFFVFIKRRQQKENLYFSFCCICVALYAYFCFRLYIAGNYETGIYWQRYQLIVGGLLATSFLWFIGYFVQVKSFKWIIVISIISLIFILLELVVRNELTLPYNHPKIKCIQLGTHAITYYEAVPGPISQFQFEFFILGMVYLAYICVKYRKNYEAKYSKFFFASIIAFFMGVFNDIAVSMGLYKFIYCLEYMYMFIILNMAAILSSQFTDLHAAIEELNKSLEQKIKERTKELVEKAHKAGMAEIATETLHNIGNILNSINASLEAMHIAWRDSPFQGLGNANKLLAENIDRLDEFIGADPRGKKLMHYYLKLDEPMKQTSETVEKTIRRIAGKIDSIRDVIIAQQNYAGVGGFSENVKLSALVDDALAMETGSFERWGISISKEFAEVPTATAQKAKLVHILVNLFKNAKSAMMECSPGEKKLTISISQDGAAVFLRVKDSGSGIQQENLTKIFSHGFTTKKDGHGFGLHSCANYMKEMGGEMWAESEGAGKGAVFVLKFPLPRKA
jgi:signal transduction histidine kinase